MNWLLKDQQRVIIIRPCLFVFLIYFNFYINCFTFSFRRFNLFR